MGNREGNRIRTVEPSRAMPSRSKTTQNMSAVPSQAKSRLVNPYQPNQGENATSAGLGHKNNREILEKMPTSLLR